MLTTNQVQVDTQRRSQGMQAGGFHDVPTLMILEIGCAPPMEQGSSAQKMEQGSSAQKMDKLWEVAIFGVQNHPQLSHLVDQLYSRQDKSRTLGSNPLPPKLEKEIPVKYLPDILTLVEEGRCLNLTSGDREEKVVTYHYIRRSSTINGPYVDDERVKAAAKQPLRHAVLYLSDNREFARGAGSRSQMHRAALELLPPLSTTTSSKNPRVTVVAKVSNSYDGRYTMAWEGEMFNTLATAEYRDLHQGSSSRDKEPKTYQPVIPKFFGYYEPSKKFGGTPEKRLPALLLTEDCGTPIETTHLQNPRVR